MAASTGGVSLENVTTQESYGVITGLKARYLVVGASGASLSAKIADALAASGIPAFGDIPAAFTNLILVNRSVSLVDHQQTKFYVDCEYLAAGDAESGFIFRGSTSLSQVERDKDIGGVPITVSHTFSTDPAVEPDPQYQGKTLVQGGTVSVLRPQMELTATGILSRDFPQNEMAAWEGYTNSEPWANGPAGFWLCSSVNFKVLDVSTSPQKCLFEFTFQGRGDGWNPWVTFKDPRTGDVPYGLVDGVGRKHPAEYPARDYNTLFPTVST